jgi:hypothetical protein
MYFSISEDAFFNKSSASTLPIFSFAMCQVDSKNFFQTGLEFITRNGSVKRRKSQMIGKQTSLNRITKIKRV